MYSTLILNLLPKSFSNHPALQELKSRPIAPTLQEIEEILLQKFQKYEEIHSLLWISKKQAQQALSICDKNKIIFVDYWSVNFPEKLRNIPSTPWGIYVKGSLPGPSPALAIVGTRKPNFYGFEVVKSILQGMKYTDLQIVSGLAFGIDALAHQESLKHGLKNFAVLGCGIDQVYPIENTNLSQQILDGGGGLISEFPPKTLPTPWNFPWRNRIISGLSDVVWIPQGTYKSGSLHTANHAGDQDKVLCATPGDIFSELSELPHKLIKNNAQIITEADDLKTLLKLI